MSLENTPTLYPTVEELNDPIEYLSNPNIISLGFKYGLIKLVPSSNSEKNTNFNYITHIDKDNVSFNPRLQNLSYLNLLNRARLFFIKQLYNFFDNIQPVAENFNIKPYLIVKSVDENSRSIHIRLYLYDLFIEIVKKINPNIFTNAKTINHDKYTTFHRFDDLFLLPLVDILNDNNLWSQLTTFFNINNNSSILLKIFKKYLSSYYLFLYHFNIHTHTLPKIHNSDSTSEPVSLLDTFTQQPSKDNETLENIIHDSPSSLDILCHICNSHIPNSKLLECQSCNNWFHSKCFKLKYSLCSFDSDSIHTKHCHECVIGNSVYGFPIDTETYTIAQFEELYRKYDLRDPVDVLEKKFWAQVNSCMGNDIIKYGADIPYPLHLLTKNSLNKEDNEPQPINLLNLPNDKKSLLKFCKKITKNKKQFQRTSDLTDPKNDPHLDEISGMTLPWLYVGSRFSTFCWHMEDQYTLSANYQHEGSPKVWYSISPQSCFEFGKILYETTPDLFTKDNNLVHHLTTLISPYDQLVSGKIVFYKTVQNPGEFIITFPQCYHSGFNLGYNLNEAVNFTTDFWVEFGVRAVNDYKYLGKPCVFDIYLLFEAILKEFLCLSKVTNWNLYKDSYRFLLNYVNVELERLFKLKKMKGLKKFIRLSSENYEIVKEEYNDEEDETLCRKCQTMCTFAYYIPVKDESKKNKADVLCLEHGLKQAINDTFEEFNLYMTRDIKEVFSLLSKCGTRLNQN